MPPIFYFCNSHSRLPHATHVRDSIRDYHSRLTFATPLATDIRDSCSCDYTAEGRTVLTPQHHLPSVPTLTLIKKIWNLLPGLASTSSYYPPSCPPSPVALCPLTCPLAHHPLQRPLPPCQAPCQHPHLYHTL